MKKNARGARRPPNHPWQKAVDAMQLKYQSDDRVVKLSHCAGKNGPGILVWCSSDKNQKSLQKELGDFYQGAITAMGL